MDVSGLFSDGDERGTKETPSSAPAPASPGRDGHHDRPTHLQAVAATVSQDDPDQARRLLRRIADEADAVAAEPGVAVELDDDDEPIDLENMSPVQRIQAMREGRLAFPDIGGDNDGDHSLPAADDAADSDDNVPADSADGTPVNEGSFSDFTDGLTGSGVSSRDRLLSAVKQARSGAKRKPIVAAIGAVTVAGLALYLFGVGREHSGEAEASDSGAQKSSVSSSVKPSPTVSPIVDGPIIPVNADASPEVCGEGSTPGMDGFSRNKDTAWTCQNPFGFIPGTKLAITLPSMTALAEVGGIPGFNGKGADHKDNWPRYPLVAAVMWYFDDGTSKRQEFTPERKTQTVPVGSAENPVYTKTVQLVVLETRAPTASGGAGSSQTPSTTAAPNGNGGGLFGDLGQWGERLGGGDGPRPAAGGGNADAMASSFAMSGILLKGHAAR